MNFKSFKEKFQDYVLEKISGENILFTVECDKDELWNLYLDSFPPGTNEIFRERREHDCSCCRHFIKTFGNVVIIKDDEVKSIWDLFLNDGTYSVVVNRLSDYIRSKPVNGLFITKEAKFGTDKSRELGEGGSVITWEHFYIELPSRFVAISSKSVGELQGHARANKEVFKRSLDELSKESIDTVLELIAQGSLYKGDEWKTTLQQFRLLWKDYHRLPSNKKDNFCWKKSSELGGVISKIRNHSIGVLLIDISNNMDLDEAVKRYEKIVAPSNYKRPKAIFTKKMVEQAERTITLLGLINSLGRRFAVVDDITARNVVFLNKDVAVAKKGNVFDEMKQEAAISPRNFSKIEGVHIDDFIKEVLPEVRSVELLLENRHEANMFSLIAPQHKDSPSLFKWRNGFSWAYNGNITDSMKEIVKSYGGSVEGVLRFTIQWNEKGENQNDFDAHCLEPNGNLIHYPKARHRQSSTGMLDVDIIHPGEKVAVENIIYLDVNKMPQGTYKLYVHVFSDNGGKNGFRSEIEFDGQIYSFDYQGQTRQSMKIPVAEVTLRDGKFSIKELMPSATSTKSIWNLQTNQFHRVSICMFSPNYWAEEPIWAGNKHYFFALQGCVNESSPNGFFNEFLRQEFMEHKRVFEALGSKMRVADSNKQLSGLGFSSTKRESVICRVSGAFTRFIKLNF